MIAKGMCAALAAFGFGTAVAAGPLDELMPVPQKVTALTGAVSGKALGDVRFVDGSVEGAPAAVADQAYLLEVAPNGVTVTASGRDGRLNARKTLDQLVKLGGGTAPACRIVDWPELKWRGFMLDVGRNYLDVPSLKDMLDVMAAYKLNLFHWHLTEYFAWRLQSKRYPQLAKGGFFDPFGWRHAGMAYSQEEFRDIVDYAWERGITVMPELDVPGHALAFRRAFGFERMTAYGADRIVADLFDELCALVPAERMPFVHLGGDEVWKRKMEGVAPETLKLWAQTLAKNGRRLVNWIPGEPFPDDCPRVAMQWSGSKPDPKGPPVFDANCLYIEAVDPFEVLPMALFRRPCPWADLPAEKRWGAVFCAWHDGAVGEPYSNVFRNQQLVPGFVICGNSFWNEKAAVDRPDCQYRMPYPDDPAFALAVETERRVAAQRDRALADSDRPFHFLRQCDLRWRVTDVKTGKVIAKDLPCATITPYLCEENKGNLFTNTTGLVTAEMWIRSPKTQTVGAWIGFTGFSRDHGLVNSAPLPKLGEWNRFGATVELNGAKIDPPKWKRPGLTKGKVMPDWPVWSLYELDEEPFTDQEYFMREPTPVTLKEGWNHVKLTLPMTEKASYWVHRWIGTFIPVLGPTDHPREVPGLEYSSDPK